MGGSYDSECVHCARTITHTIGEDDDPVCVGCGGDFCSDACRQAHEPGCTSAAAKAPDHETVREIRTAMKRRK